MRIFLNQAQSVSDADVVGGVFVAQRELLKSFRAHVLAGAEITPEIAEILIELFLAERHQPAAGHVDEDNCISFRDLLAALGYSAGLLSRRIAWLCQRSWAETKRAAPNIARGVHGNCQRVRITKAGENVIGPVWRRYEEFAKRLLAGISASDLAAHYRVNEIISDKLSAPRPWMEKVAARSAPPIKLAARKLKPAPALPLALPPKNLILEPDSEFLD